MHPDSHHSAPWWERLLFCPTSYQHHHDHDHDHDHDDHHDNDDDGEVSNMGISLREFKKCLGPLDNSSGVKLAAGCGELEEIKWIWTGRWNIIASSSSTSTSA